MRVRVRACVCVVVVVVVGWGGGRDIWKSGSGAANQGCQDRRNFHDTIRTNNYIFTAL
jgi:hypothetical protein